MHEWSYLTYERPKTIINNNKLEKDRKEPIENLTTWVYEEGSFVPTAKITEKGTYSIFSDYLGRPIQAFDKDDKLVWHAKYDIYGKINMLIGNKRSIPFRQLGQYEDSETELYYNRFRYYSADTGAYISRDPIELESDELNLYAYAFDSNSLVDIFGLKIIHGDGLVGGRSKRIRLQQLFDDIHAKIAEGKPYHNTDGQLPKGVDYTEYDYDSKPTPEQRAAGGDRGTRRVVVGDDGRAYYTNDHFENFQEIKKPKPYK